ncbi:M28 family peptidase [Falsiroseomonas sp. HC035]|uniref:M28 family peptidase n=1 Tax=Falsiroseomonas sp. HC035 TaxID=3390999 RepID=UPI003D31F5D8
MADLASMIAATLRGEEMQEHLEEFARRVKLSGTPEEAESFAYLQRRMGEYGFRTTLLHHPAFISLPGPARLLVDGNEIPCITHSMSRSTAPDGLTAEIVDVGDATEAQFRDRDLRGKIILADGIASPAVAMRAAKAGVLGSIHVSPNEHLYEMCISPVWGSPSQETVGNMAVTTAVTINNADGAALRGRLAPLQMATIHAQVDTGWRQTPILVCDMDAPGAADAPFVLLSGHHDTWYYGVMDNGAANATMMETARACAEHRESWKRSLRVCFWSGHSHGRYSGSSWYADEHWAELEARCVAHVNVDSTGGRDAVDVTQTGSATELWSLAAEAISSHAGQDYKGKRSGRSGDQSFWGIGVPAMFGTLSGQPASAGGMRNALGWWWHTPHDTIDKVDPEKLMRDTRIVAHAMSRLLTDQHLPLDYARHAAALRAELEAIAARLGTRLDLAGLIEAARQLERRAAGGPFPDATLMRVSRALVPMDYTSGDRFVHDSALPHQPWPVLQPLRDLAASAPGTEEAHLHTVSARRARNRVAHAVSQALVALGA